MENHIKKNAGEVNRKQELWIMLKDLDFILQAGVLEDVLQARDAIRFMF